MIKILVQEYMYHLTGDPNLLNIKGGYCVFLLISFIGKIERNLRVNYQTVFIRPPSAARLEPVM
jgi:hypothetical protein